MRFPVATGPTVRADFRRRFDSTHEGTDIFAPAGAELVAVADGVVRQAKESKGGFAVYLTEPNGTQYYYAHLEAFAYPMMPGETRRVQAGDVLGYVGTSGNARGREPHVHFEYRPQGGQKADPYPLLERLAAAEEPRAIAHTPRRPPEASRRPARFPRGRQASKAAGHSALFLLVLFWGLSKWS